MDTDDLFDNDLYNYLLESCADEPFEPSEQPVAAAVVSPVCTEDAAKHAAAMVKALIRVVRPKSRKRMPRPEQQERNRQSAQINRDKRRDEFARLRRRVDELEQQNTALRETLALHNIK
jgi:hypothetical protein